MYSTTVSSARGLRDIVIEVTAKHLKELLGGDGENENGFCAMMDGVGEFGKDMTKYCFNLFSENTPIEAEVCLQGPGVWQWHGRETTEQWPTPNP